LQSTLTLLVTGIRADHTNHTLATDDLAVAANFLDRGRNSHFSLLKLKPVKAVKNAFTWRKLEKNSFTVNPKAAYLGIASMNRRAKKSRNRNPHNQVSRAMMGIHF